MAIEEYDCFMMLPMAEKRAIIEALAEGYEEEPPVQAEPIAPNPLIQ